MIREPMIPVIRSLPSSNPRASQSLEPNPEPTSKKCANGGHNTGIAAMHARITRICQRVARLRWCDGRKLIALIYVVIFIAVMAVRPAPAAELPRAMLGAWCGSWGYQFERFDSDSYDALYTWRIDDVKGCANRGGFRIHK